MIPGAAEPPSCRGHDQVHRLLVALLVATGRHDATARALRAAAARRGRARVELVRHETAAEVLRDVRLRLARALIEDESRE